MNWDKNYLEWCSIVKQIPNERDEIIFITGATFKSIDDEFETSKNPSLEIEHINGWIELHENEKLFDVMTKYNCACRFDDGSQCRFEDDHPVATLTHFKLVPKKDMI